MSKTSETSGRGTGANETTVSSFFCFARKKCVEWFFCLLQPRSTRSTPAKKECTDLPKIVFEKNEKSSIAMNLSENIWQLTNKRQRLQFRYKVLQCLDEIIEEAPKSVSTFIVICSVSIEAVLILWLFIFRMNHRDAAQLLKMRHNYQPINHHLH